MVCNSDQVCLDTHAFALQESLSRCLGTNAKQLTVVCISKGGNHAYMCQYTYTQDTLSREALALCTAEIVAAGATMVTHGNCLYVFGGMDDERQEQMSMWRWNLSAEEGFEVFPYRHAPLRLDLLKHCRLGPAVADLRPWTATNCREISQRTPASLCSTSLGGSQTVQVSASL